MTRPAPPPPAAPRTRSAKGQARTAMASVLAYDIAAGAAAMYLAVKIRYAFADNAEPAGVALSAAGLFALASILVFPLLGAHRGVWRFTALADLWRLVQAITLATLILVPAWFLMTRLQGFPRTSLLIHLPLAVAFLALPRAVAALSAGGGIRALMLDEDRTRPPAVLVGRENALDRFLKDADARPDGPAFRPRALITLSPGHSGRAIRGRRIFGDIDALERTLVALNVAENRAPDVILVEAPRRRDQLDRIVDAAQAVGADLVRPRTTPGQSSLTPLDAADLLNRPPRRLDLGPPRALIQGRRVLVTGAGGTIGSELTRQVVRLDPASLTLMDASEYNLYEIDLELREGGFVADAALGDVRDRRRVDDVMDRAAPDVVLHAAALKHVPLMEENPAEAFLTNVGGTVNVGEAARSAGVSAFVLISTDKAVSPSNVMGASKRVAELFVQALDADAPDLRAISVRFGNVLGSTGSVVPLFERQIARGGPITVTHPEITRYFMTTQEAAALVLQAAAMPRALNGASAPGGGVYVLDMGDPVRIEDLARQLCRLRGVEPDLDIAITHTGLRPGEKLHEDIFYAAEDVRESPIDGVMMALAPMLPTAKLRPGLDALTAAAGRRDRRAAFEALRTILPEYRNGAPPEGPKTGETPPPVAAPAVISRSA